MYKKLNEQPVEKLNRVIAPKSLEVSLNNIELLKNVVVLRKRGSEKAARAFVHKLVNSTDTFKGIEYSLNAGKFYPHLFGSIFTFNEYDFGNGILALINLQRSEENKEPVEFDHLTEKSKSIDTAVVVFDDFMTDNKLNDKIPFRHLILNGYNYNIGTIYVGSYPTELVPLMRTKFSNIVVFGKEYLDEDLKKIHESYSVGNWSLKKFIKTIREICTDNNTAAVFRPNKSGKITCYKIKIINFPSEQQKSKPIVVFTREKNFQETLDVIEFDKNLRARILERFVKVSKTFNKLKQQNAFGDRKSFPNYNNIICKLFALEDIVDSVETTDGKTVFIKDVFPTTKFQGKIKQFEEIWGKITKELGWDDEWEVIDLNEEDSLVDSK